MNIIDRMEQRLDILRELAETEEEFKINKFDNVNIRYIEGEFYALDLDGEPCNKLSRIIFNLDYEIVRPCN